MNNQFSITNGQLQKREQDFNYPEFSEIKKSNRQEILESYTWYFGKAKKKQLNKNNT